MRAVKLRVAIVLVAALAWSTPARAEPTDRKVCLAAVDDGQKLRDEGKLTEARQKFLVCASAGCPAVIVKQCDEWAAAVEHDTPSVLFRVRDASGKELVDVRVLVDGKPIGDTISGQPLSLEPRDHSFRFELADGTFIEERVVLRVGEKNRMIESSFPPARPGPPVAPPVVIAPPPPEPPPGFRVPLLGWVGGGVFVVGAATTAIYALQANSREDHLRRTCAPRCHERETDTIERKIAFANVGMFVGLAGLGFGVVMTVLANRHTSAEKRSGGVRIVPTPGGIAGTF